LRGYPSDSVSCGTGDAVLVAFDVFI
jgi:hypothetical protein